MKKYLTLALLLAVVLIGSSCNQPKSQNNNKDTMSPSTTQQQADSPTSVVESFMLATLGTLPNAQVDYDLAKTYMTTAYASELTTPMFVPMTYGIQDGPTDYQVDNEEISGNTATVTILGLWGSENQMYWQFELEKEAGEWKVSFINPGQ